MLPLIVSGTSPDSLDSYLKEHHLLEHLSYQITPTSNSIGLDEIKALVNETRYAADPQIVFTFLIENGQLMTPAAQNALLKTLEEARSEQQFVITTTNYHALLPTIVSRCRLVVLVPDGQTATVATVSDLISSLLLSPANLLTTTDGLINHEPKQVIEGLLLRLYQANDNLPTRKRTLIISLALTCLTDLSTNQNPKLALDHFLLKSHSIATMNRAYA